MPFYHFKIHGMASIYRLTMPCGLIFALPISLIICYHNVSELKLVMSQYVGLYYVMKIIINNMHSLYAEEADDIWPRVRKYSRQHHLKSFQKYHNGATYRRKFHERYHERDIHIS